MMLLQKQTFGIMSFTAQLNKQTKNENFNSRITLIPIVISHG